MAPNTYTYDPMGRVLTANRTVSGTVYNMSYVYDYMGNVTRINYPSSSGTRRLVEYTYKTATGELDKARDITGTAFDYVTGASYSDLGPLSQLTLGNTVHTDLGWNKRFQLTSIYTQKGTTTVHLKLGYVYFPNGQIRQFNFNYDPGHLQTWKYTYDELLRLATAQRGPDTNIQTKYSYDYDRYGNRWLQDLVAGTGYDTSHSFNAANNRVTTAGFSGVHPEPRNFGVEGTIPATCLRQAGITDTGPSPALTYNLENLMTAAGTSTYTVDAQGRRVKKTVSGVTTDYFYLGGVVVSEKQGSNWTDYIFFGNQRIAKQTGSSASTATYQHTDHLGSARLCTDSSGNLVGNCTYFYEPFGELQAGITCSLATNYRFAGMEFDSETGFYHTWFRQYDTSQGRWLSVDPLPGSADAPQSLNRYAYVSNDPVNLADPLGLHECPAGCEHLGGREAGFHGCACPMDESPPRGTQEEGCTDLYIDGGWAGTICRFNYLGWEFPDWREARLRRLEERCNENPSAPGCLLSPLPNNEIGPLPVPTFHNDEYWTCAVSELGSVETLRAAVLAPATGAWLARGLWPFTRAHPVAAAVAAGTILLSRARQIRERCGRAATHP